MRDTLLIICGKLSFDIDDALVSRQPTYMQSAQPILYVLQHIQSLLLNICCTAYLVIASLLHYLNYVKPYPA